MVKTGWYPDAANPDERHYYDGERWTVDAADPTSAPDADADSDLPIFEQPRRQPGRARIGAAVVLAGAAVAALTWAVWPAGDPAAPITVAGRTVSNPVAVLRDAQRTVAGLVASENGTSDESTRCYFARSGPGGDVQRALRCGPVLFPGGSSPASYVTVPVRASITGPSVTLTADRDVPPIATAPGRVELVRPDGARPPSDDTADRLQPPRLPAGPRNLLIATTLPDYVRARAVTASLIGRDASVTVGDITPLPAYGRGDAARTAPEGQRLVGFTLRFGPGAISAARAATARAQFVSSDADARVIPAPGTGRYVVAAIPANGRAYVALTDGGLTQRLELPSGRPADDVVALSRRTNLAAALRAKATVAAVATLAAGGVSKAVTLSATATRASLRFWPAASGGTRPSDPDRAFLSVDLSFTYPGGEPTAFKRSQLRVDAGGRSYPARFVDGATVFEVPASFTSGNLVVSGRGADSALVTSITVPRTIPISIPTQ